MAKVTSKLQVTVPRAIARELDIRPGSEIEWIAAGDTVRMVPQKRKAPGLTREMRLKLFDRATERQRARETARRTGKRPSDRGWTRDDLYYRGRAR